MIQLGHLFDYLSRRHVEFQTAWGVVGQFSALITFETFAMILCDKFGIRGYPSLLIYAVLPIAAIISVTYLGSTMIRTGYAHKYLKYGQDVNKDWANMMQTIERLDKYIEDHDKP